MFHCMSGIQGGDQDTVAWVSVTDNPMTFVFEIRKEFQLCVQEYVQHILRIKLFPN